MITRTILPCIGTLLAFLATAAAESIAEINGNKFLSPLLNKDVSDVTGLVTAKGPAGFWIRSTSSNQSIEDSDLSNGYDSDASYEYGNQITTSSDQSSAASNSLYVYDNGTITTNITVGDVISLSGRVSEYRSSTSYLYLTELTKPTKVKVISKNNDVKPLVIGQDTASPPTEQFSSLDKGDVWGLPNNSSTISSSDADLQPDKYGLDFWESLSGELVTVKQAIAISKPTKYGETFVVGNWKTTGRNGRGGLTMTAGDSNPEAIMIGDPLDGTKNPKNTKLGDTLQDITGVVSQAFGYYRILPLTALSVSSSQSPALPEPPKFTSNGKCSSLTIGDYNIENFAPNSTGLDGRAEHIVTYLGLPDLLFLQEIQDGDGPTDDGEVTANKTLDVLVKAIAEKGKVEYAYVDINPVNDKDGGQPGGNIRQAYLYKADVLTLANPKPGSATDAAEVLSGPKLSFNPGRIDPSSSAWDASRKPLAAQWRVLADNSTFFTVNVHLTSKLGGSPIEGDARPPVNGGIDQRMQQTNITAAFIADILAEDPNAAVIMAGDCNEFTFAEPLKQLMTESGLVDLDEAAGVDPIERYTYIFDMSSQELDHFFVSKKIAGQSPKIEHVHVNTWVSYADQISDHDPSVAQLNVC